ncbi:MAG: hypothetical protein R3A10_02470 [Caldilineaceae bacterium]
MFLSLLLAMIAPIVRACVAAGSCGLKLADGRLKIHRWILLAFDDACHVCVGDRHFMSPRPAPPRISTVILDHTVHDLDYHHLLCLTGLVNRSIITVDPQGKTITSMYGPLPVLRRQRRQIGFGKHNYEKSISGRWPPIWRYPIFAKDFSGKTMGIVNEIDWKPTPSSRQH